MSCDEKDLTPGSLDTLRILFVDRVKSALTGKAVETPIDLTLATGLKLWCTFVPLAGAPTESTLPLIRDADQVANKGYAYRDLGSSDLVPDTTLEARAEFTDGGGKRRIQPNFMTFEVGVDPAV